MERLAELDRELLLFFNGFHAEWLDPVMLLATKTIFWLPLYLVLVYLMAKSYQWNTLYLLLGVALTIVMADQITSGFMKPFFERLRPSQEPALVGILHTVNNYKGGLYGFASSHAANSFGVAMFLWLLFKGRHHWMSIIFVWAALMSYTRIYLGVHYPGDILAGTVIGLFCGWVGFLFGNYLVKRFSKNAKNR